MTSAFETLCQMLDISAGQKKNNSKVDLILGIDFTLQAQSNSVITNSSG
jgi:hypothetical protein